MNNTEETKKISEKEHLDALISEWKFQCAEGIETYPKDRMFEICYTDAYKQGRKEAAQEAREIMKDLISQLKGKACFSDTTRAEAFLKE